MQPFLRLLSLSNADAVEVIQHLRSEPREEVGVKWLQAFHATRITPCRLSTWSRRHLGLCQRPSPRPFNGTCLPRQVPESTEASRQTRHYSSPRSRLRRHFYQISLLALRLRASLDPRPHSLWPHTRQVETLWTHPLDRLGQGPGVRPLSLSTFLTPRGHLSS